MKSHYNVKHTVTVYPYDYTQPIENDDEIDIQYLRIRIKGGTTK